MLNTLDDYYLLKEVIRVTGYSVNHYRIKFKEDIIILRHDRYIKKKCIEYRFRSKLTDLYNHIPLKEFSDYLGLYRGSLEKEIDFMKKNNVKLFDYTEIENKVYIVIDDELKKYLKKYTAFIMHTFKSYENCDIKFSKLFSTRLIGFY